MKLIKLELSYIEDSGALGYQFFQVPKLLLEHESFDEIDFGAKILYSLMLNRISLSAINNFRDSKGRLYIIYTVENVMKQLRCSNKTAVKFLRQLDDIGLIEKKRQGQGKPTLIFLRDFKEVTNENLQKCKKYTSGDEECATQERMISERNLQKCKKYTSRDEKCTTQEVKNVHSIYNNNNYNNSNYNNINLIHQSTDEGTKKIDRINIFSRIKKNIEYEEIILDKEYNIETVDNLVNLICNTVMSCKRNFSIGQESIDADVVKTAFLSLRKKHIEYVIDCVCNNANEIKNINAYLLTALYNANNTIDVYWQHKINREIPLLVSELEKRKKSTG